MSDLHSFIALIGGPIVAALILLSLIATTFILARIIRSTQALLASAPPAEQLLTALQSGQDKAFNTTLNTARNKAPSNCRNPRINNIRNTWQMMEAHTLESARNEAMRELRNQIQRLSFGLRPLEVIATVAPLLGLFGTVLGMIEAFKAMEAAGAQVDPAVLSGGIWQALLTTAVGLGVAIPVSLIHSLFERQHESLSIQMLSDSEILLNNTLRLDASPDVRLKAVRA